MLVVSRPVFLVSLAVRHSPEPSTRVSQLALNARRMIHPRSLSAAARLLHRNRNSTAACAGEDPPLSPKLKGRPSWGKCGRPLASLSCSGYALFIRPRTETGWSKVISFQRGHAHDMPMTVTEKQVLAVRCPTCGAKPGERCELNTGQPRTDPHRDRWLIAEDRA
jgi:hypothetical protein